jgi:glucose-1-phosphate cytidylyltransferase
MMTYGDGVSNVNLAQLLAFHRAHGKTATITACARQRVSAALS